MSDVAERVASRFDSRFLRGYAKVKIRRDPAYEAVYSRLPDAPILDLGCGAGVFAFYLRERGFRAPIAGVDHDASKVAAAWVAATKYRDLTFRVGDAREPFAWEGTVMILDLLHYFSDADQAAILGHAARAPMVIIRDAIDDGSWRYRATYAAESLARGFGWLKAERLHFPRRETLGAAFDAFTCEEVPMWKGTPFNNYLFVFRRLRQ